MGDATADDHHAYAQHAERLAEDARQPLAGARVAADRHEQLASVESLASGIGMRPRSTATPS